MSVLKITRSAIVIALYVALTYAFYFLSYGQIQFRIAEILVLLCFYKKDYSIPLILGCAIANIGSPLGIVDVGFGTTGTAFAVAGILLVSRFQKSFRHRWIALFVASLAPVIFNAIWIGLEFYWVQQLPFFVTAFWVAVGEFTVVSVFGVLVFTLLERNKTFLHLITADAPLKSFEGSEDDK